MQRPAGAVGSLCGDFSQLEAALCTQNFLCRGKATAAAALVAAAALAAAATLAAAALAVCILWGSSLLCGGRLLFAGIVCLCVYRVGIVFISLDRVYLRVNMMWGHLLFMGIVYFMLGSCAFVHKCGVGFCALCWDRLFYGGIVCICL